MLVSSEIELHIGRYWFILKWEQSHRLKIICKPLDPPKPYISIWTQSDKSPKQFPWLFTYCKWASGVALPWQCHFSLSYPCADTQGVHYAPLPVPPLGAGEMNGTEPPHVSDHQWPHQGRRAAKAAHQPFKGGPKFENMYIASKWPTEKCAPKSANGVRT